MANSNPIPKRINVGCGQTSTDGWLNIDNSPTLLIAKVPPLLSLLGQEQREFAEVAKKRCIRYGHAHQLPADDGTVEVVYSSHTVEHLSPARARQFLAEARRVLKPGGLLRLALPDLRIEVQSYIDNGDADAFISHSLLATPPADTWKGRIKTALIGHRHHMWMYDGQSLTKLVESAGFVDITLPPAGETRIIDPGPLDLFERSHESVYLEAIKP